MFMLLQVVRSWLARQNGNPLWHTEGRHEDALIQEAEDHLREIIREEIRNAERDRRDV